MSTNTPKQLLKQLEGLRSVLVNLSRRTNAINEVFKECQVDIIDEDIFNIYETFDTCVACFEKFVTHYRRVLKEIQQQLQKNTLSNLEQRKNDMRQLALARLQEDIAEELDTDRKSVEEPRYITYPRQKKKTI